MVARRGPTLRLIIPPFGTPVEASSRPGATPFPHLPTSIDSYTELAAEEMSLAMFEPLERVQARSPWSEGAATIQETPYSMYPDSWSPDPNGPRPPLYRPLTKKQDSFEPLPLPAFSPCALGEWPNGNAVCSPTQEYEKESSDMYGDDEHWLDAELCEPPAILAIPSLEDSQEVHPPAFRFLSPTTEGMIEDFLADLDLPDFEEDTLSLLLRDTSPDASSISSSEALFRQLLGEVKHPQPNHPPTLPPIVTSSGLIQLTFDQQSQPSLTSSEILFGPHSKFPDLIDCPIPPEFLGFVPLKSSETLFDIDNFEQSNVLEPGDLEGSFDVDAINQEIAGAREREQLFTNGAKPAKNEWQWSDTPIKQEYRQETLDRPTSTLWKHETPEADILAAIADWVEWEGRRADSCYKKVLDKVMEIVIFSDNYDNLLSTLQDDNVEVSDTGIVLKLVHLIKVNYLDVKDLGDGIEAPFTTFGEFMRKVKKLIANIQTLFPEVHIPSLDVESSCSSSSSDSWIPHNPLPMWPLWISEFVSEEPLKLDTSEAEVLKRQTEELARVLLEQKVLGIIKPEDVEVEEIDWKAFFARKSKSNDSKPTEDDDPPASLLVDKEHGSDSTSPPPSIISSSAPLISRAFPAAFPWFSPLDTDRSESSTSIRKRGRPTSVASDRSGALSSTGITSSDIGSLDSSLANSLMSVEITSGSPLDASTFGLPLPSPVPAELGAFNADLDAVNAESSACDTRWHDLTQEYIHTELDRLAEQTALANKLSDAVADFSATHKEIQEVLDDQIRDLAHIATVYDSDEAEWLLQKALGTRDQVTHFYRSAISAVAGNSIDFLRFSKERHDQVSQLVCNWNSQYDDLHSLMIGYDALMSEDKDHAKKAARKAARGLRRWEMGFEYLENWSAEDRESR
ncbi:uncharacterized protein AB675_11815 [Cyphellophora attinorum]|uniref:Uncharacterized protein n=1 Tax=Cyphellophora attinorum TaxID=1664694 RepID=A0A0N1HJQ5_9EURO|nr:uncharacterized protein AB675_11815 [Phialophora attinorum]KPI36772.1 hypothetical protein AB675_11815 [Phialophora attinorum]